MFIALNVAVYFLWQKGGFSLGDPSSPDYICQLQNWAAIPYEVTHPGDQVQIAQGCPSDPDAAIARLRAAAATSASG